ncbi:MAG: hypothetical protein ACE5E1_10070 [Phycisphaerae bacterium]
MNRTGLGLVGVVAVLLAGGSALADVIISEYYESTPGTRKCIELYNTDLVNPVDLGPGPLASNNYRIATYTGNCVNTGNPEADARGVYTFGTLGGGAGTEVIPAGGVYVICAVDNGDGYPIDLLLPFTCAPCGYTGGGCPPSSLGSPIAAFTGDDALVLFGPDIATPFDNVIDVFAVPFEGDFGPRGANPNQDAAWERKFSVTTGIHAMLGFDSCNFDGLKDGTAVPAPPGTPANAACLAALDTTASNQWLFEGLNPFGDNQNHTLGTHAPQNPPNASDIRAITKLNTLVDITLNVTDIDFPLDTFDVVILTIPATGKIFDGATEITAGLLPYTIATGATGTSNPIVTFVPDAGVGTDTSFTYRGEQTSVPTSQGNTATVTVLVEDEGVLITEVMYNPASAQPESQWEWVEIYNATAGPILLGEINNTNCPVCDDNLTIGGPGGTPLTIAAGEILVLVGNITGATPRTDQDFLDLWGVPAANVFFVDSATTTVPPFTANFPFLSNSGTQLFLYDSTGDLVDYLPDYSGIGFPVDDGAGSIYLTDPVLDNDDGLNWLLSAVDCVTGIREVNDNSIGSPGAVPTVGTSFLPPCATAVNAYGLAGAPTAITITLQGDVGGAGGNLGFKIASTPTTLGAVPVPVGILHDGPTIGGAVLGAGSIVTDPLGRVTFEDGLGTKSFFGFQFQAFSDAAPAVLSNKADATIAAQDGRVIITEIMANPNNRGVSENYWEWLEVLNTSTTDTITLTSMQSTNGPTTNDVNLIVTPNVTLLPGERRIIARDALDGATVRTQAEFETEWSLASTDVIYVPNPTGGNEWDGLTNAPFPPGRFVTIWSNFTADADLLDVVPYQIGANGWPANSEPNSIFYRGDANGAPFTADGNDLPQNWQESAAFCPGDGSVLSDTTDTIADVGSPLVLPTNPDLCVPSPCATCLGDLTGPGGTPDGKVDALDIQAFADIVVTPPGFPTVGCADFNGDGDAFDYLPDLSLFVDALLFGSTNCTGFVTTHQTNIDISLTGAPVAGDIELFIGGCDPLVPCDTLHVSPPFICFERVTVTGATTAADLALALGYGADGVKDGLGGLDEFCLPDGADVTVTGSSISITFTRSAGQVVPCCFVQDTDGRFSTVSPFDFVEVGGVNGCVVTNLLNGVAGDEGAAQTSGFSFTKTN